jgi:hypothetical protein
MRLPRTFCCLLGAIALAGCGGRGEAGSGSAADTTIVDTAANSCQVFIDEAATVTDQASFTYVVLYVHIDPTQLDGAVTDVDLYAKGLPLDEGAVNANFATQPFTPVPGVANEYSIIVNVWGDNPDFGPLSLEVVGAVYAQTTAGTRWWVNPSGGGNFTIDSNLAGELSDTTIVSSSSFGTLPPYASTPSTTSLGGAGAYLNPSACAVSTSVMAGQ